MNQENNNSDEANKKERNLDLNDSERMAEASDDKDSLNEQNKNSDKLEDGMPPDDSVKKSEHISSHNQTQNPVIIKKGSFFSKLIALIALALSILLSYQLWQKFGEDFFVIGKPNGEINAKPPFFHHSGEITLGSANNASSSKQIHDEINQLKQKIAALEAKNQTNNNIVTANNIQREFDILKTTAGKQIERIDAELMSLQKLIVKSQQEFDNKISDYQETIVNSLANNNDNDNGNNDNLSSIFATLKQKQNELKATLDKLEPEFAKAQTDLAKLQQKYLDLSTLQNELTTKYNDLPKQLDEELTKKLSADLGAAFDDKMKEEHAKLMAEIQTQIKSYESNIEKLGNNLNNALLDKDSHIAKLISWQELSRLIDSGQPFEQKLYMTKTVMSENSAANDQSKQQNQNVIFLLDKLQQYSTSGISTKKQLQKDWENNITAIMKKINNNKSEAQGWWDNTLVNLQDLVTIRKVDKSVQGNNPEAILSRAEAWLREGNIGKAVEELDKLEGELNSYSEQLSKWYNDASAYVNYKEISSNIEQKLIRTQE